MATPRFFSNTSLFIPEATGQVIGFLRNSGQFKFMQYSQLVKSSRTGGDGKPVCLFVVLDPDEPVRVVTDQEFAWESGDDAPEGANMIPNFNTTEVRMFLRAYPYRIPEQTVDTATLLQPMPIYQDPAHLDSARQCVQLGFQHG